jgi:hypothetical protein
LGDVTLRDRLRRWWNPGKWRDEHPEISDGKGFALSAEQRLTDAAGAATSVEKANDAAVGDWRHRRTCFRGHSGTLTQSRAALALL